MNTMACSRGHTVEVTNGDFILAFHVNTEPTAKGVAEAINKILEAVVTEERSRIIDILEDERAWEGGGPYSAALGRIEVGGNEMSSGH
jgi:hypothetical protein